MEEMDQEWQGCYGDKVTYGELENFLESCFKLDDVDEKNGAERFATCIWGHTGLGKTSLVKQFKNKPVEWRGKKYEGYDVRSVPIAQFEEMGDLHGMPDKHMKVKRACESGHVERWVPVETLEGYQEQGWTIEHEAGIRTMYAAPDWVPTEPGPCILILDDWNRAGARIIKGIMQFLQEYGLLSWRLPPGCHIVLTSNPDEQDYFVTSLDPAVLQRFRCATLKFDAKEWSVWAEREGIDKRIISYVLAYPEMAIESTHRTSTRSLSELGRYLAEIGTGDARMMEIMANSVLDEQTVSSLMTFMERDFEMVIDPESIIKGESRALKHIEDLMTRKEKRIDVMGVTCDRLYAYLARPDVEPEKESVENVQEFLTNKHLTEEMRYVFVDRLNRASNQSDSSMDKWFMGNKKLMKFIMDLV